VACEGEAFAIFTALEETSAVLVDLPLTGTEIILMYVYYACLVLFCPPSSIIDFSSKL
jgi:hypothetical protein